MPTERHECDAHARGAANDVERDAVVERRAVQAVVVAGEADHTSIFVEIAMRSSGLATRDVARHGADVLQGTYGLAVPVGRGVRDAQSSSRRGPRGQRWCRCRCPPPRHLHGRVQGVDGDLRADAEFSAFAGAGRAVEQHHEPVWMGAGIPPAWVTGPLHRLSRPSWQWGWYGWARTTTRQPPSPPASSSRRCQRSPRLGM